MEGEAIHSELGVLPSSIACATSKVPKSSKCASEAQNNSTLEESTVGKLGGIQGSSIDSIHGRILGTHASQIIPNPSQSYR